MLNLQLQDSAYKFRIRNPRRRDLGCRRNWNALEISFCWPEVMMLDTAPTHNQVHRTLSLDSI